MVGQADCRACPESEGEMAERAPGSWGYRESLDYPFAYIVTDSDDEAVAGVFCSYAPDPETEAVARLFAAAPDMLAALEAALTEDIGLRCADQLRAAIAKATAVPDA